MRQSSNRNRDNGLIGIMPCRNPSHGMKFPTWSHFGSAFSSDQCTIFCPRLQTWYDCGKKADPTCPLCSGRQTTEHALSSCKVALSQGFCTWMHKQVIQELAVVRSMPKVQNTYPVADAVIIFHRARRKFMTRNGGQVDKPEEMPTLRV